MINLDNKKVIEVRIKEGTNQPYYLDSIAYKRVGSKTPPIAPEELETIILKKNKIHWDSQICEGATIDDIDEKKVRQFLRKAKLERNLYISEDVCLKNVLLQLSLIKDNTLVNAAVILFGKEPERFFIQSEVKCISIPSTDFLKPYTTYQTYDGTLFEQVDKSIVFILDNIQRPLWINPEETKASNPYELPRDAIREAIVNAIVHRDYTAPSKVQVRVFRDRVEIWNPGSLPAQLSIDNLKKAHPSVPHNPLLFRHFYKAAYVEDVGGGTIDILGKCRELGLPEPEFEQKMGSFVTTIWRSVLTDTALSVMDLNQRQKNAIDYIKQKRKITNNDYQKINNVSKPTSTRELSELVTKKIFTKLGKTGKGTYYILFERAHKGLTKGS